ncbi:hypothetical protein FCL47_12220 [Desulfopila sp. IMCC35006]|uniref:DUF6519 domain-containing protein n=1 Tax=Desulfopila sp. IMCC35006 TaxID=2569542 RepID=UPI0010ABF511|nr:DUF6519 domain-containing protein [Desulfopila sp. IMCC35006]TKB25855.1 hypothetical protein FCL47_12220 [Desulfopila sp. IMCC35006]
MKTEISRDSHQSKKRYSGVYQQQGRMLTDSDWNELVDILKERLSEALRDVVGSEQGSIGGTPRHRALRIVEDGGVKIQPGHIYIDGMAASLPGDATLAYDQQKDFPAPPVPSGNYVLYADVWEWTVTQLMDERLRDKGLHGADTCSRKQMLAQIKWCPDSIDPQQSGHNPARGDAALTLTLLQKTADPDGCDPCAAELDIDTRIGNYLFRVEVHDVQGDADNPSEITLKWSSENGAEQFLALPTAEEMPAGFISDKWVYEFFDETSERHLGVHLNSTAWQPARLALQEFSEASGGYSVPTIPGSSDAQTFIRRWDGYCKVDLNSGVLLGGIDRGVLLSTTTTPDSLGYVSVGSVLEMALNSLSLELELSSKSFVAGDFWLADVREAEHSEGSVLIDAQPPQGITHYYLTLGRVNGGVLQSNPEIDRKYAFPALTEMTSLFMAGGDGQEIVPGEALPQPLRVGAANGEWPVIGATVRFEIEEGGGTLSVVNGGLTNTDGIAECEWTPDAVIGTACRVKAALVDPDHPADPANDFRPPVYFYANLISADQVAYEPNCPPDATVSTVHHLLLGPDHSRLGADGYYTVKEVLDALLCELKADHIPYDDPACTGNTVGNLLADLDFNSDELLTVKDVLDTLLCRLEAEHVPYDPEEQGARWDDINEDGDRPTTVQQAIDDLAENLESTDIRYQVPDCSTSPSPSVRSGLGITPGSEVKVDAVLDALLCDFNADDLPLDRNDPKLCPGLKADSDVRTVQQALNYLCTHKCCEVTVGEGGWFSTLEEAFTTFKKMDEIAISICLLPGNHIVKEAHQLKDRLSIRIRGCGAMLSKIYLVYDKLELGAEEIQLRDVSIIGGDEAGESTERGSLILAGGREKNSHIVVENCLFSRVFQGNSASWLPLVRVEGLVKLNWHGNHMTASRIDEEISGAFLPDKGALAGATLDATLKLEEFFYLNPLIDPTTYEKKLKAVAENLVSLNDAERDEFINARAIDRIDNLPVELIHLNRRNPAVIGRLTASGRHTISSGAAGDSGGGAMMRMALAVAPKNEIETFYTDIKSLGVADAEKLLDRIRVLASLVTSPDYALALASSAVSGAINNNQISGYIGLHYIDTEKMAPLSWKSNGDQSELENKANWAKKNMTASWGAQGQLTLRGNKIMALHSMVLPETFEAIQDIVLGKDSHVTLNAYESMSITDNYFDEDQSSFISKFMTLNGNQFLFFQQERRITQAYTLGYRGIFLGNMSFTQNMDGDIVIEQILHDFYDSVRANFLRII